jgi:hypothetical protein
MSDYYKVDPPFVMSFSGGRTSGYLLRQVLDAWGGTLPAGGVVMFANTGREHAKTLDFVKQVERWCPIVWIEYRAEAPKFAIVDWTLAPPCTIGISSAPVSGTVAEGIAEIFWSAIMKTPIQICHLTLAKHSPVRLRQQYKPLRHLQHRTCLQHHHYQHHRPE